MMELNVCTCNTEDHEAHTCPFAEEILNSQEECNCCPDCTYQCAMDI